MIENFFPDSIWGKYVFPTGLSGRTLVKPPDDGYWYPVNEQGLTPEVNLTMKYKVKK
ncbi:hypothetical protein UFOVP67_5 [uncultured Caudovirales phage]|uniref:Uncharacterized protein n=1 Tax=uncultured Caudovirales phage TaxID=2100421 RepID=A0A6J5T8Z4_9CAUD|nr:hypothetical protein UFOVP67_5 [uncultured Caudovirales phage]